MTQPRINENTRLGGILAAGLKKSTLGPLRSALSTWGDLDVEPDLKRVLLNIRNRRPRLVILPADRTMGLATCDRLRSDPDYGGPTVWLLSEEGLTARLAAHCLLPTRAQLVSVMPLSPQFIEREVAPLLPTPERLREETVQFATPRLFADEPDPEPPPPQEPPPAAESSISEAELAVLRKSLHQLQEALLGSREQTTQLRAALAQEHARIESLEDQAVQARTQSARRIAADAARLAEQQRQSERSVSAQALQDQVVPLKRQLADLQAAEQSAAAALAEAESSKADALAALAEQARVHAALTDTHQTLEANHRALTEERDAFRSARDELAGERARLRSLNDRLVEDLRQVQDRHDQLHHQAFALQEQLVPMRTERDQLREERNRLIEEHVPLMEERDRLEQDVQARKVAEAQLVDQLRRAEGQVERLAGELDRERTLTVELELKLAEASAGDAPDAGAAVVTLQRELIAARGEAEEAQNQQMKDLQFFLSELARLRSTGDGDRS